MALLADPDRPPAGERSKLVTRNLWTLALASGATALLAALSFVATPVKFLADGVPLAQLLAVGRVTFRASLVAELCLLLPLLVLARDRTRWSVVGAGALLAVQWLGLMPALDARTMMRIAGDDPGPSSLHLLWVLADGARVALYAAAAVLAGRAVRRR